MMRVNSMASRLFLLAFLLTAIALTRPHVHAQEGAKPLQVCATVPELGSLVREVGGDRVSVTVFAKGTEDPHFIEAKPSFIKALSQCDLYIQAGMDSEIGWAPVLLRNARNGAVLPEGRGVLDASTGVAPPGVPTGPGDRAMGEG